MNIEEFSCPLDNSEKKTVEYVDLADLRVKVNGRWVPAIFKDGGIRLREEDYKKLFS